MPDLFTPYKIKSVELRNRIAIPPMCQYSATNGFVNDWHTSHYASLARGGAGLVIVEATAVSPEGRITPACLGLWNDEQAAAITPIVKAIKDAGAVAGIQIGHAGRKANSNRPWEGDNHIKSDNPNYWETISPSAIAFGEHLDRVPREMSLEDIERVCYDFVQAAIRARDAGFEWLELHFAHGYLGQSFLSQHANHRKDSYGGTLDNRCRFLLETFTAVRKVWPEDLPLTVRLGVVEFDGNDAETLNESIYLINKMRDIGLDFANISIGFSTPNNSIPWGKAFLAPIAARVRVESNVPVASAWGFEDPHVANRCIKDEQVDLVMVGRKHLANPHWAYQAAIELQIERAAWLLPAPYAHWLDRY